MVCLYVIVRAERRKHRGGSRRQKPARRTAAASLATAKGGDGHVKHTAQIAAGEARRARATKERIHHFEGTQPHLAGFIMRER